MKYNWQQSDWPEFRYDTLAVNDTLYQFIEQMGRLSGVLKALPVDTQMEAIINTMVSEAKPVSFPHLVLRLQQSAQLIDALAIRQHIEVIAMNCALGILLRIVKQGWIGCANFVPITAQGTLPILLPTICCIPKTIHSS